MYREQTRYGNDPKVVRRSKTTFAAPLKWADPAKVFTCSWSDFFIEQADPWRPEAWAIIRQTPHLTYQILTKRPYNILERLPSDWGEGYPNVWLGVSVENEEYTHRITELAAVPAALRFVSYEPALGGVNFIPWLKKGAIDWLISGGESGADPRPARLDWFRFVREQCVLFGVPYFHKQHGGSAKVEGSYGGHMLDGAEWRQFPTKKG